MERNEATASVSSNTMQEDSQFSLSFLNQVDIKYSLCKNATTISQSLPLPKYKHKQYYMYIYVTAN